MNGRWMMPLIGALGLSALLSCVTVNVYFPAAAIKDFSKKIEEEVQKEAAQAPKEPAQPAPATTPPPSTEKPLASLRAPVATTPKSIVTAQPVGVSLTGMQHAPTSDTRQRASDRVQLAELHPSSGVVSLFDTLLGVTPVYAADAVGSPDVTSPAIRKIISSRAARVDALNALKSSGVVGENNKALVEIRNLAALTDLKARADAQRLVKAENSDREELFSEIAVAKKVDASQIPKIQETYATTLREMARPGDWIQTPDGAWKQK